MPDINKTLLKFKGFKYAISLDLNMGCYHIRLSYNTSTLCTITIPWGKHQYKYLLMRIVNSPVIFQKNTNDLFCGFEFINEYIDNLLVLAKWYCIDNAQNLESTLNKLKEKVFKYNIENYFFGKPEMEYLGFCVTRDGIKPINKR